MNIVTIGEAMLELRPDGDGFAASVAGDAYNTAVGLRRRGHAVAHVQDLGEDVLVERIRRDFDARGVRWVGRALPDRTNGIYFVTVDEDGERRFQYHRAGSAAGATLAGNPGSLFRALLDADLLYLTGVTAAIASDAASLRALVSNASCPIALGLNLRDGLHRSRPGALLELRRNDIASAVRPILDHALLVFGSEAEFGALSGGVPGHAAARAWQRVQRGRVAVLTRGAHGAQVWHDEGECSARASKHGGVVDTTGAGDAFAAGFLDRWLHRDDLQACLRAGLSAGACAVSHAGALPRLGAGDLPN